MNKLWVRFSLILIVSILIAVTPIIIYFIWGGFTFVTFVLQTGYPGGRDVLVNEIFYGAFESGSLITGVAIVVGAGVGIWMSRGLTKPITQLAQAASAIGQRQLGYQVQIEQSSQEIMDLAESFNQMSADLNEAEQLRKNMMADVSHELRTPLTILEGNLRAAIDQVATLEEQEIVNLYGQTQRLRNLVEDLHLLATAEAHQLPLTLAEADLAELVQEVAWNFEHLAQEKGVDLIHKNAPNLPTIVVDRGRLAQVLINLISNALRHTQSGDQITIETTANPREIVITVSDNGTGMAPEQVDHVFDRFYRAESSRSQETGGAGLGLAIVRAIVEAHRGHAKVESTLSQGSTFTISLPLG